ncbi:pre-rRNA-processing protein ESF2 [Tripterygium wilfordii]|uniref:pre-rRNA-processing protein ESF2 n=1 Tax=Tripterygium wilfordii TaxID=458696 RepID=UPI0018F85D17|nr:pre-rRNA-processing protein ESF2 [Tripterygium wilfordii]XP_038711549.1 pre-rRNA-processing protein ESF2 [Tripterygium wilfordii]
MSSVEEGNDRAEKGKIKREKRMLIETMNAEEERGNKKVGKHTNKKKKMMLMETTDLVEQQKSVEEDTSNEGNAVTENGEKEEEKQLLMAECDGKEEINGVGPLGEKNQELDDGKADVRKHRKKKRLLEEAAKADRRGVCYLSRIPPQMDRVKLRHILSQYGEIQRIYLAPEDITAKVRRKKSGGFRGQEFSEGWVEFTNKSVAKRVANMLNGEQIGGKKRSQFYFDLWNIKYLSKFKWDDLTEEIAYKNAIREQKLALEISAANRERNFYLAKVDQSRALSSIEERLKKKQKFPQESGDNLQHPPSPKVPKVIRQFPQNKPVSDDATQNKPRLSKEILAGVFGGS